MKACRSAASLATGATVACVAAAHPDLLPELAAMAVKGELELAAAMTQHPFADLPDLEAAVTRGERDGTVPVAVHDPPA